MKTQLVFDFFSLCQLKPIQIHPGVWQVYVDEALMKELDGWRAQARLLQFTFEQAKAETFGADLIAPGSYRYNSILEVAQKQGIFSQGQIPQEVFYEPNLRKKLLQNLGSHKRVYVLSNAVHYTQYLSLDIQVRQLGLTKHEWIERVFINLSTGEVLKLALPTQLVQGGKPPEKIIRKRRYGLKKAYLQACNEIESKIRRADQNWSEQAWQALEGEQERLKTFYEGNNSSPEYNAKKAELEQRLAPKIQMDALRGALMYVPVFYYRLVIVEPNGQEKTRSIYYDPINNLEELE